MTVTVPGSTLGIVGGGQLGRMLAEAAAPLGVEVVVLDPTPDCPAAPVVRDQIVGDFDDPEAFRELASRADVLTFEIELADSELLDEVSDEYDLAVHPSPDTLSLIEDKLVQKRALDDAGVPVPPFRRVDDAEDLRAALDEFGSVMLKARTGGYDGRGNVPVRDESEVEDALDAVGGPAMAEAFVDFARELSVIAVQGDDEVRTFPVGENIHEAEILRETVVPARTTDEVLARADEVARDVLSVLDGRGVFGIELFETQDGDISVNEIAPRPHNSGHWTIEGARTSQFEQHVRAVLGWPLGSTARRSPTVMANVLGTVDESRPATLGHVESVLAAEGASLHWYGKDEARPLRKMGHLTVIDGDDADIDSMLTRARDLRDGLTFE
ncbi:5-(carboxyamino)imidazole ribonucleotide synthase [Halogeometricum borinquense]|uniref:N5-carboxyaminoimidazole ribonucleotide synthase n=1 Tax=Halogeometricum borinquense TaxID=60847 RepID=A0A6C0UHF6_9EURY|nr:5-(carboxyamino)imidazole ribonucleotide synthase [Halogeometricum borinquense]QIB73701.1 5-(carboxyamino)imidazole ribonucleotide synthase [Halogeometricum borinquense]QIQ76942.1 5-(carboxyamino)imidazole ribonucleotide synthase [Halogeometricum borinquense]